MTKTNSNKTLLGLLAALALCSCGGGTSDPASSSTQPDGSEASSSQEAFDPDTPVTIKFWHTMGKQNEDILTGMIREFNKVYPNITVEESSASGSYDDLCSLVLSNVSTGNLPTMAFCYPDHVAEYIDRNAVVNMETYVDHELYGFTEEEGKSVDDQGAVRVGAADFVRSFWEEGKEYMKEGLYSVPFAKSTEALFYNKTLFDQNGYEVPKTWDEMWDLCRRIRSDYPAMGDDGEYTYYPLGYDSDSNLFITLCEQLGLDYTTNDLTNHDSHFIFNNEGVRGMLTELKGLYDEGLFKTKGTSANSTYTSTKFTSGEIFMSIGSTGGTSYNDTQNFEVGVAVPPTTDLNDPAVISQGPSICFFNRATKAQTTAAWLFYKFISNAQNSVIYGVSTGYQPVRYSSYETPVYERFLEESGADNIFVKVAETSATMFDDYFTSPVFVGSAKARDEVGKVVPSVLMGTKSVNDALNQAMSNCVNYTRG